MALDCDEMRVGVTGHLYTAPVGTAPPASPVEAVPAPWVDLGYLTEDGLTIGNDTNREDFNVWQSNQPCRSVITSQIYTITFSLVQRNAHTLRLAFGNGTIDAVADGWLFTPPPAGLAEAAFVLEVIDGPVIDRWLFHRGIPALTGEVTFTKTDPTVYEIEVTLLDTLRGVLQILSNDDNVEPDDEGQSVMQSFEGDVGSPAVLTEGDQTQVPPETQQQTEAPQPAGAGAF